MCCIYRTNSRTPQRAVVALFKPCSKRRMFKEPFSGAFHSFTGKPSMNLFMIICRYPVKEVAGYFTVRCSISAKSGEFRRLSQINWITAYSFLVLCQESLAVLMTSEGLSCRHAIQPSPELRREELEQVN